MTHEQYVEMVKRLEEYAGREPKKYTLRVGLLAALGYAYIFLVLAVVAALLYLLVWLSLAERHFNALALKFGWVLLMLAWVVLRALWVRMPPPRDGVRLTRDDAPLLFGLVDELSAALEAPRVDVLQVNGAYNASLMQVPRLGPFGWHRNYLTLGLPLMQALTPEQFRVVLAHELGHLSGNHGRFGSWVYRVRRTWMQLLARLESEQRWGAFVFHKFVNWFAPYFDAYSFVLVRRHEYEADRTAAQLTSARQAALALAAVEVKDAYLREKYWPEIFSRADEQREPTPGAFAGMWPVLRAGLAADDAARFLRRSLAQETGYEDTHPALADRLSALGLDPKASEALAEEVRGESGETAAEHFLGALRGELSRRLDAEWVADNTPPWRERHDYVKRARRQLAVLEEKALTKGLTDPEALERAKLTAEFKGAEEAVALLRELTARKKVAADAHWLLGGILLTLEDEAGVEQLEMAMAADSKYVFAVCQSLYEYFRSRGREEEAEGYRRRLTQYANSLS